MRRLQRLRVDLYLPNGSGTVVDAAFPHVKCWEAAYLVPEVALLDKKSFKYANRMKNLNGSAIRDIFKNANNPDLISFAGGNPGSFALPGNLIADISYDLLLHNGSILLQYGQTEGYLPLRETLIDYLLEIFHVKANLDQLLVTTGSMQGLDLLLKTLINPGDVVLTESPAFLGALQAMSAYEANMIPVKSDDEGIDIDHLEEMMRLHHPKLLYIIPTFQNPTGVSLTLERRKAVASLASKYQVVVAEDDPYRALRYKGLHLPPIKFFDKEGWVVLLGSFSKVISPGLRVGFMAGDADLIRRCCICKQSADVHTPLLNQAIVDAFLRKNLLNSHVQSILPLYAELMETMLEKIAKIRGISSFTKPEGGLFIFASLKEGLKAVSLFTTAIEHGLSFVPGEFFYVQGGHQNTLRLNFSSTDKSGIEKGMDILNNCINLML